MSRTRVPEYDRAFARVAVGLGHMGKDRVKTGVEFWVSRSTGEQKQKLCAYLVEIGSLNREQVQSIDTEVKRLAIPCSKCKKPRYRTGEDTKPKGRCPHCGYGKRKKKSTKSEKTKIPSGRQRISGRIRVSEDSLPVAGARGEEPNLSAAGNTPRRSTTTSDPSRRASQVAEASKAGSVSPPLRASKPASSSGSQPTEASGERKGWNQLKSKKVAKNLRREDDQPSKPIKPGRMIGKYEVTGKLGQGGMGVVYKARHAELERDAAVKLLPINAEGSKRKLDAFKKEAQVLARLDHPNIIGIYDVGIDGEYAFIAMELAQKGSVLQKINAEKKLNVPAATRILLESARALAKCHIEGLVHRDIKPANILLGAKDEVKLTDFGLVRDEHLDPSKSYFAGKIVGSPAYMSPEQADCGALDSRTDIYGLGVTAYHMLTGRPPFRAKSAVKVLIKQMREPPPRVSQTAPEVPQYLDDLVLAMMAKRREDRPQTADKIIEALRSKRFGLPKKEEDTEKSSKKSRRKSARMIRVGTPSVNLIPLWIQRAAAAVLVLIVLYIFLPLDEAYRVFVLGNDIYAFTVFDEEAQASFLRAKSQLKNSVTPPDSVDLWARSFADTYPWSPWPTDAQTLATRYRLSYQTQLVANVLDAIDRARGFIDKGEWKRAAAHLSNLPATNDPGFEAQVDQVRRKVREHWSSLGWAWVECERPFMMKICEVSRAEFDLFLQESEVDPPPDFLRPQNELEGRLPQADVSFEEAQAYAEAIGAEIPTLSQYVAACKGKPFPFGDEVQDARSVNARGIYDNVPLPVDTVLPGGSSPDGILHLSGNVGEWVVRRSGPAVIGGAYCSEIENTSLSRVVPLGPLTREPSIGFRCVIDLADYSH